jgi:hypothetical protein
MSDTPEPVEQFDVYEIDEDDEEETLIGQAEFYSDGTLRLMSGEPERLEYVADVFSRVNAKPEITLKAPPAEEDDPLSLGAVTVARGDEGFLDAMQTYLLTYYGLRLG